MTEVLFIRLVIILMVWMTVPLLEGLVVGIQTGIDHAKRGRTGLSVVDIRAWQRDHPVHGEYFSWWQDQAMPVKVLYGAWRLLLWPYYRSHVQGLIEATEEVIERQTSPFTLHIPEDKHD